MKIAFFNHELWEKTYAERTLQGHTLDFFVHPLAKHPAAKLKAYDVVTDFVYSPLARKELAKLPKLKMIATRSTGYNHIDIAYCAKKGIVVSNVPTYGEDTVAEYTFALLLSLTRNIYQTVERTIHGNFSREGIRGFDLAGKTIGIVGGGNIGMNVAQIANGFDMKILVLDLKKNPELQKKYGFTYATSLPALFRASDVVTFHVPLTKKTTHLLNMRNVKQMKKGAFLINTSRGAVVDSTAVLYGIQKKILAGAGLDVVEEEECFAQEEGEIFAIEHDVECLKTALENHALLHQPNVLVTPHNAYNSQGAIERISRTTIDNIAAFLKGKPKNVVS